MFARSLVAGLLVLALLPSPSAQACKPAFAADHVIQPERRATDSQPPVLGAATVTIIRGMDSPGCQGESTCEGQGGIDIALPVTDDQSAASECGFRLTLLRGKLPEGLSLPSAPVRNQGAGVHLVWFDGESGDHEEVSFVLGVAPIDLAGNVGTSIEVPVADEGSGCALGGRASIGGWLPVALVFLWMGLRRFRRFARVKGQATRCVSGDGHNARAG